MSTATASTVAAGVPASASRSRASSILGLFAKLVGPAALTAAGMIGAGAVATRLLAGAWFGFDLIWVALAIIPMVIVTLDSASRVAIVSGGRGLIEMIRADFGEWRPREHSPYNPILRTRSADEQWWSKGHGTLVEGPDARWWIVYHAYENGYYTLGRQTLLEPIEWTDDGWFRTTATDSASPLRKPVPSSSGAHGMVFSDDFSTDRMGLQWSFYGGTAEDQQRYRYENKSLVLRAKGTSPADSAPLWFVNGDHAYEMEVEIDADPSASAGLLLFYNRRLYVGLGYSAKNFIMHSYGLDRPGGKPPHVGQRLFIRLRNDRHIVSAHYSADGTTWELFDRRWETSGYHHNVGYDFLSLRPALYAAGSGEVRFKNFKYRALP